jgi:predicted HicB family RNase H-like nuclease
MSQKAEMHPKPVQVRMKAETHSWIHEEARRQDRSANWVINHLLDRARSEQLSQESSKAPS